MSIENLTSSERAYLRSLANTLDAIFQLGKGGINENFIKQIDDVLEVRELIKISLLETCEYTVKEAAKEMDKLETILRNIERYDGTTRGQEDVPMN